MRTIAAPMILSSGFNSNDGFGRPGELNFTAASEDEAEYPPSSAYLKKGKVARQDPMSHRIIEKRRRDRMNNCLADLSRLIPPEYLKKGRGRVEKTEIIEMAIRHIKFLQDRANGLYHGTNENSTERSDGFLSGYQEASAEAVRYLIEVQGYGPGDGLCVQMAAHLRRNCDHFNKVESRPQPRLHNHQSHSHMAPSGSSSETTSSSGGSSHSHGYSAKTVIAQAPPLSAYRPDTYEPERTESYSMECDRSEQGYLDVVSTSQVPMSSEKEPLKEEEPLPLDGRRKCEPALRAIRKPEHTNGTDDYLQSYKFKNSIERRFSRSQDEAADMLARNTHPHPHPHTRVNYHKRRRAIKLAPSTSTSNSGSTEEARDTSPQATVDVQCCVQPSVLPQDTSSESPHHHPSYEKPAATQFVPVFALNTLGKYYVPLSVDYACLARYLGPGYDIMDARAVQVSAPLHPVTIHVNFQPLHYHVKREPNTREWK